jgi:hypothetical protein
MVHFLNKGGGWRGYLGGRSSRRGKGPRVARRADRRWWRVCEIDEERGRMKGEKKKALQPNRY